MTDIGYGLRPGRPAARKGDQGAADAAKMEPIDFAAYKAVRSPNTRSKRSRRSPAWSKSFLRGAGRALCSIRRRKSTSLTTMGMNDYVRCVWANRSALELGPADLKDR